MILTKSQNDAIVVGEDTSKKARISDRKLSKLQYLLTKGLYKDPISAVITEWTNNGVDSVVQAGKNPKENPVIVSIIDTPDLMMLRVQDFGTGLDDNEFENICMNYLESTKEEDNDTIGHFGIGMKAFLALERTATFHCVKNGVKRKYIVYEGPEFVQYDLLSTEAVEEENGVIAELPIYAGEVMRFIQTAKSRLAYYDTAVLLHNNVPVENKIYRDELFQFSPLSTDVNLHLAYKDVYYSIDWNALGKPPIRLAMAIRIGLDEGFTPTPSRESYITNEHTRKLIMSKIEALADHLVERYNSTVKEYDNIINAWDEIGKTTFNISIADTVFTVNPITIYSKASIKHATVKHCSLRSPSFYKEYFTKFFEEYDSCGIYTYGTFTSRIYGVRHNLAHNILNNGLKVVVVPNDSNLTGNLREYFKSKYTSALFVRKKEEPLKLGKAKVYGSNGYLMREPYNLRYVVGLLDKEKSLWRDQITEWRKVQSEVFSVVLKDETNAVNTKAYRDFVASRKSEKKKSSGSKQNSLGKQVGDVTLAYSIERYNKISYKKSPYKPADLAKNTFVTVLLNKEESEKAKIIAKISESPRVKFALVGPNELKKIPEHYQFINYQTFMKSKHFLRIATAIKFDRLLKDYFYVQKVASRLPVLKELSENIKQLQAFRDKYLKSSASPEIYSTIIELADKGDYYDKSLWDVYKETAEKLKVYDFLQYITLSQYATTDERVRCSKVVNQMYLFRRKYYDDLPKEIEITIK